MSARPAVFWPQQPPAGLFELKQSRHVQINHNAAVEIFPAERSHTGALAQRGQAGQA